MGKLFRLIIIVCFAYFAIGFMAVYMEYFNKDQYLLYAGIVGAIASVIGLFSFLRPPISKDDLQSIEMDSLRKVVKASDDLKELEQKRSVTKEEIDNLAIRKQEMEFLVRKASLSLFLREQKTVHQKKILTELSKNEALVNSLEEVKKFDDKLSALNEEIESDPNVELLKEIIESSKKESEELETFISKIPSPALRKVSRIFIKVMRALAAGLN